MKNKNIFLHDKKKKVEPMSKELAKQVNVQKNYERHYEKNHVLKILDEIPDKPIGYFTERTSGNIIQTTDEKGMITVNDFVLQFGKIAPKTEFGGYHINDLTKDLSKILK
jgi:hypothetical protein